MFGKKAGLVCIVAAAMGMVGYAQTKPRARSTNLQSNSGYLGVGFWEVTPDIAKTFGLKDASGLLVTTVDGEAAARAGIQVRDVIVEFNGQKITNGDDFTNAIIGKAPGTKINLTILRGNTKQSLTATLESRPPGLPIHPSDGPPGIIPERLTPEDMQAAIAAMNAVPAPRLGFYIMEMMPQLAAFFGVHEGVLVESVVSGSRAEKAGLKAGDVVTKVNGIPVSTERELIGVARQAGGRSVSFTVVRNKKPMTLSLEIAWNRDLVNPWSRDEIN